MQTRLKRSTALSISCALPSRPAFARQLRKMATQLEQQVERLLPLEQRSSIPDKMQGLDAKSVMAQHTARSTEGFRVVRRRTCLEHTWVVTARTINLSMHALCRLFLAAYVPSMTRSTCSPCISLCCLRAAHLGGRGR